MAKFSKENTARIARYKTKEYARKDYIVDRIIPFVIKDAKTGKVVTVEELNKRSLLKEYEIVSSEIEKYRDQNDAGMTTDLSAAEYQKLCKSKMNMKEDLDSFEQPEGIGNADALDSSSAH